MTKLFFNAFLNISSVLVLAALIIFPLYFTANFSKVAGVKSESKFLLVPQVDKFPGMTFSQSGNLYTLVFTKQASSQAYLGVLIINNPTEKVQTYSLQNTNPDNQVFFGNDIESQQNMISLPANSSTMLSAISKSTGTDESLNFSLTAKAK